LPYSHSALRSGVGWITTFSRLFLGLQTTEGIASVVCLVRLRRGRRLAHLEHYSNILTRRTIQYIHIQQLTCLEDGACDGDIIRAGGWIPTRVIVHHNNRCCVAADGGFKELAYPYL